MTALVVYLQNTLARLRERQEGQTMAEYALILGGIAVVVIAGILILGPASATSSSRPAARSRTSRARSSERRVTAAASSGLAPGPGPPPSTFDRSRQLYEVATERVLRGTRIVPMMSRAAPTTIRSLRHHVARPQEGERR